MQSWRTLFEASPCLRLKDQGFPFAGLHIGGKIAVVDQRNVLLSLGEHEFDGVNSRETLSQTPGSDYGKTVLIDVVNKTHSTYTTGHRNSQGLHVDEAGKIWLTEHGPEGGDELK